MEKKLFDCFILLGNSVCPNCLHNSAVYISYSGAVWHICLDCDFEEPVGHVSDSGPYLDLALERLIPRYKSKLKMVRKLFNT